MIGNPATVALVYSQLLHVGGVETHLLSLLQHTDPARYRWLIVAPASSVFAAQARRAHIIPWTAPHACDSRALLNLIGLLRAHRVQLLHAHSPRAALYGGLAARLLNVPMVATVHLPAYYWVRGQTWMAQLRRWAYQQIERGLNRWLVDQVIYVSKRVCAEAQALGIVRPGQARVVPNGIELESVTDGKIADDSISPAASGVCVLCCVGRLEAQKGLDVLLEALHHLRAHDWRLWLVGDGPLRGRLQAQARQLELLGRIDFLGFRADVGGLLRASDIFILPSRYEAMSLALLEAMAAGCPCVVTDVGENAAVIETGVNGLVVPVEDAKRLAAALEQLLTNALLRQKMGQAARQVAAAFDASHMGGEIQAIYAALLARQA
jgi:glycosyltransferase involved in cell wall biosynthesis